MISDKMFAIYTVIYWIQIMFLAFTIFYSLKEVQNGEPGVLKNPGIPATFSWIDLRMNIWNRRKLKKKT